MLEWPEPERAALIGGLYASARGQALAEVLADVESDPKSIALASSRSSSAASYPNVCRWSTRPLP